MWSGERVVNVPRKEDDSVCGGILAWVLLGAVVSPGLVRDSRGAEPLKLHPENPHYVVFRGKPAILVASTEHYGAVLNRDFNFRPYLDELKAAGLNYTRSFGGIT